MIRLFHTKIGFYRIYPSGFYVDPTKLLLKRVFGKETEMRTLLGTMNEEIEKMKKAVNIDYAPVTLDKSDKKVGLSFL